MITLKTLQDRLGLHFTNTKLLELALTHKSVQPHNIKRVHSNNERLEFLGDSVLDLVLSDLLMYEFPDDSEGDLTKKRASMVNENSLAEIATQLGIDSLLKVGRTERDILNNPRILASALEALIGAIYLDRGFQEVYAAVAKLFMERLKALLNLPFDTDYKTQLQERIQKKYQQTPEYNLVRTVGPEHQKVFEVEVKLKGQVLATSEGRSKKQAEQNAAKIALEVSDVF